MLLSLLVFTLSLLSLLLWLWLWFLFFLYTINIIIQLYNYQIIHYSFEGYLLEKKSKRGFSLIGSFYLMFFLFVLSS